MGGSFMTIIKEARLKKGYTQLQMAQMIGVAHLTYILWEKGVTKNPTPENKEKLEKILGIKLSARTGNHK